MQKILTIFDRDWEGNRGVINKPIPECEWVFKGEGVATEKVDGTNIKVRIEDEKIVHVWKRKNPNKEQKKQDVEPWYVDADRSDPQDKHIFKAVDNTNISMFFDGEYPCEAYGGKIQGNPLEAEPSLYFFTVEPRIYQNVPRDFDGLKDFLKTLESRISPNHLAEGIVFHRTDEFIHPDENIIKIKMAKIKRKDFK